jgi:elongation factor P
MPKASDIRKGQAVIWDGQLYIVHEAQRVAKGNWRSYMQLKLKNFKSGLVLDQRMNMDEKLDTPHVEDKQMEFLYRDGDSFVLMDLQSFEQTPVSKDVMVDADLYLKGNEKVMAKFMEGLVIGVDLPNVVELAVKDTAPQAKGATATNQSKDAEMETGLKVRVPPFIENGEVLRIDTRTGEYMERA